MQAGKCDALRLGLAGTFITLTLNIIGFLALKHPAALPFHDQWWTSWFPLYAIWFVFLLVGLAHYLRSLNKEK